MFGLLSLTGDLRYKVKSIHSNQLLPRVHTMEHNCYWFSKRYFSSLHYDRKWKNNFQ